MGGSGPARGYRSEMTGTGSLGERQMARRRCLRLPDIRVWEMDITAGIIAFIALPPSSAIPSLRLLQKADETLAE